MLLNFLIKAMCVHIRWISTSGALWDAGIYWKCKGLWGSFRIRIEAERFSGRKGRSYQRSQRGEL